MADLKVNIGGLLLKNPVMTASGTFGYGEEFADFVDLSRLGGVIVKGTTLHHREGNPYPRLASLDKIPAIELNISCPNVKEGGMAFGTSCQSAAAVVKAVRAIYPKTLIVKLSPNVTDITEIARAVEAEGADAVSLINTLLGMAIDSNRRRPVLSTITGGLSGACVKPIALRMVWQTYHAVKIPIVGLGGITNATDAIEFILAGASAIEVGTANFIDPQITEKIANGIDEYLDRNNIASVKELIGGLICN